MDTGTAFSKITFLVGGVSFPELPPFRFFVVEEDAGTDDVDVSELGGEDTEADAGLLLALFFERFLREGDFLEMGGGGGVGTGSESLSSSSDMALTTELAEEQLEDELELEIGLKGSLSLRDDGLSLSDPPPDDLLLLKDPLSCFPEDSRSLLELLWDLEDFEGFTSINSSFADFFAFFGTCVLTGGSIFFEDTFSLFSEEDLDDDLELDDFELVALTTGSGVEGDLDDFDDEDDLEDLEDFSGFSLFSFGGFSTFSLV